VPQSMPLYRKPIFVFGPPIAMAILGAILIIQAAFAGPRHELIIQRIEERAASGWVVPQPSFTDYQFPRLKLDLAGSEFVLLNKHRPIAPITYVPADLVVVKSSKSLDNSRALELSTSAARALELLAADLNAAGQGKLFLNSAYRSYNYQAQLFKSKVKQYGESEALLRSAKAGFSEHQTGLAADVSVPQQGCAIMTCFGETKAGKWIAENAWKYGFIIRYEIDTQAITGYSYEPWHLRYVGLEVAKLYSERGMKTLEEFWGLKPAPDYLPAITESTNN
jgi:zinc D-Ala-D-Ala carboxypeptidase